MWSFLPPTQDHHIVGTRWVIQNKLDDARVIIQKEARLVAKGFTQIEGLDYNETFSLFTQIETI